MRGSPSTRATPGAGQATSINQWPPGIHLPNAEIGSQTFVSCVLDLVIFCHPDRSAAKWRDLLFVWVSNMPRVAIVSLLRDGTAADVVRNRSPESQIVLTAVSNQMGPA